MFFSLSENMIDVYVYGCLTHDDYQLGIIVYPPLCLQYHLIITHGSVV